MLPTGPEYLAAFFGCLYAGVVAIPSYPPRPNRGIERLESILADAEPAAIIMSGKLSEQNALRAGAHLPDSLHWLEIDALCGGAARRGRLRDSGTTRSRSCSTRPGLRLRPRA